MPNATMGRLLALAMLAAMAVGCDKPAEPPVDPAAGRLASGIDAIVRVPAWADPARKPAMATTLYDAPGHDHGDPPWIVAGTRVRVASDDRPSKMEGNDPPDVDGVVDSRFVQVLILDGEHKGLSGSLPRNVLRAATQ